MSLFSTIYTKLQSNRGVCLCLLSFFMTVLTGYAHAQTADSANSTIVVDSTAVVVTDSLSVDSTQKISATNKKEQLEDSLGIRISPDALSAVVTSNASDSAVLNMKDNVFYLYGKAKVKFEDMELNADVVTYEQSKNQVIAQPPINLPDTVHLKDRPSFTQGGETFTYDSLKYNFKSKRAIVHNARTQYGEGFVFSEQVKRNPDQSIYGLHNVYTTCALDTPHFGINAKKIKVIPGKVVASGPANIMIEQVPTPLFLPFGLFPIAKGQRSGFILPTYTIEQQRGVGLLNGGYYFRVSDHVDLQTQANLYSKGSWMLSGLSNYRSRYKYNGAFTFSYAYNKTGDAFEPSAQESRDFQLRWQHSSDAKARPGTSFSSSVNVGTSTFNQNNTYTADQILQNQFNSNITYTKNWQNKPYSLSVGARHSQNSGTGLVDVTLPTVSFFLNQFSPFQGKNSVGTRWYEKITVGYTFTGLNQISFYDSTFSLSTLKLEDFRNGMKHDIPIGATYNVFRYLKMDVRANYSEYWLTQQQYRWYDNALGGDDTLINRGFYTARDFSASVNFNTTIYGLKMFKKGALKGIRHTLIPSVGVTYTPDFANEPFRYGYQTVLSNSPEHTQYVSPYETSVVGVPGRGQFGKFSSMLNFGLNNNLQIKVRTKDSVGSKNIGIIDNLNITGGYDLAKDSFNWSNINMSFTTSLLNKLNINASASFDPYMIDYETGNRVNKTYIGNGGIARFSNANISMSTQLNSGSDGSTANNPARNTDEFRRLMAYGHYTDYVDFSIPWNVSLSYTLNVRNAYQSATKRDSIMVSNHNVTLSGDLNITDRWKLMVSTSYDLINKQIQMSQIRIMRDLHCWRMELSTIPFGPRKNYQFTLNVKAQVLQDLKLQRRRDFRDI